jgi:hypothetical protein
MSIFFLSGGVGKETISDNLSAGFSKNRTLGTTWPQK